jgi:hypothetical protein
MNRIIPLKSMQFRGLMLRAGMHYALPEDVRGDLLAAGHAYEEGTEPPLAQEDLEALNQKASLETALKMRLNHRRLARRTSREEARDTAAAKLEQHLTARAAAERGGR